MNQSPSRTIKLGKATVGLIGLDTALQEAVSQNLSAVDAVNFIFSRISENNYIPAQAQATYRLALKKEFLKLTTGEQETDHHLAIRILGPGCESCNKLNTMLFDILQRLGIEADIEQIHDLDEIWRHGVISTPALIINSTIKCTGRQPTISEVEQWLRDEIEK